MEEKTRGQLLKEQLCYKPKNVYSVADEATEKAIHDYAEEYKTFLDASKTEREAVVEGIRLAEAKGYVPYKLGEKVTAGGKYYYNNRGKSLFVFNIGSAPITEGIKIAAAHVDSPRIDLKQRPLYEDSGIGFFKTHYYGGIKKYQWTTIPLALHGTVTRADGSTVDVVIGEDDSDPVFYITDLLIHLAKDQMVKSLGEGISGESLNIVLGTKEFKDDKVDERVKLNLLNILYEKYNITEADFLSAELTMVPAYKSRDIGLDRSLIGGYGHDDRVCAYPALSAIFEVENPTHTTMAVLADKEEIGSNGNTGMKSSILVDLIDAIAASFDVSGAVVRAASQCLSADVNAAFDPNYPEVLERRNCAYLNNGVVLTKYTGSRGKSGTSDASAEFVGCIRKIFDEAGVIWQTAELGKVDQGGGGTVAAYIAEQNIDVVDLGVAVLAMHAPYEVIAKADLYMTYRAFAAFMRS
nr:aminopeptidase [Clostridia bacterium]